MGVGYKSTRGSQCRENAKRVGSTAAFNTLERSAGDGFPRTQCCPSFLPKRICNMVLKLLNNLLMALSVYNAQVEELILISPTR